ncbi:hypothetical protein [Methyloceanibacter sp.]|uniref:hypothetical protein n=1 Tax=Methyloceanibacter sp. TaxID=1965321 RepID=UPI002B5ADE3E|nr:hypothetical protein [Methyloceanibacter sp.]HML93009.1 hypothetical protein [Methyloceanibacter sp.]
MCIKYVDFADRAPISLSDAPSSLYHFRMILCPPGKRGFRLRPRLAIVTGLVAALLAFPCGPLVTALASDVGHAHAATEAAPARSEHGEANCAHRATKHESSCCKSCSSWVTARFFDGGKAILGHTPQHELPAATLASTVTLATLDQEPRLTGPPIIASLDGTSIYLKTGRFRI